jgi:hypothetical protein
MKPELGPWKSQSSRKLTSRLPDCADAAGTNAVITKPAAATVRMNDRVVKAPWSDTLYSPLFSLGSTSPVMRHSELTPRQADNSISMSCGA